MATLPTITVSDAQSARILAVFPPINGLTSAQRYRRWLRDQLIAYVRNEEIARLGAEQAAEAEALAEQHNAAMLDLQTTVTEIVPE